MEQHKKFKTERYWITWVTGESYGEVMSTYTLPELIRLQGAIIFFKGI